jgi:hypothetical protein
MICLPIMRDELCSMLAGLTLFSEMDISRSKIVFVNKRSHPSMGSYNLSTTLSIAWNLISYGHSEHQHEG